jgi:hypothetical protein
MKFRLGMKLLSMPENGWIKNNFLIYYIESVPEKERFFCGNNLYVL